jgi:hypothetical protein
MISVKKSSFLPSFPPPSVSKSIVRKQVPESENDVSGAVPTLPSLSDGLFIQPCLDVMQSIDNYFSIRNLTYLSGQREMLEETTRAIFSASSGTVTAIPLMPGGGKSTLIRALLDTLSREFARDSPVSQHIGGVIVVVEKAAEGHELRALCNSAAGHPISAIIEGVNDYVLGSGACFNGTAQKYEECLHRGCPDYDTCPLMQADKCLEEAPILIMYHARYQRHMEDMTIFAHWHDKNGNHRNRNLLLIDELPSLLQETRIDLDSLNKAESELDRLKYIFRYQKQETDMQPLLSWTYLFRLPFVKLQTFTLRGRSGCGLIMPEQIKRAGFDHDKLVEWIGKIQSFAKDTQAEHIARTLSDANGLYFSSGQSFSLFKPRLKQLEGDAQPATFIFSGTASLSPELAQNPSITLLPDIVGNSYHRLHIIVQRGDCVSTSKTAFRKSGNFNAVLVWLNLVLEELTQRHKKILIATYQEFSSTLWAQLSRFHPWLVPYVDGADVQQPKLPYFGGLNGSNQYQEATCVISLGLHRFEPRDYLSNAIALDFSGQLSSELEFAMMEQGSPRLEQLPCVLEIQDLTLARDLVQLTLRSGLRRHGENTPIELWLLQPPTAVISHLQDYFTGCTITERPDFPDECKYVRAEARTYGGGLTHAAKLLQWLKKWDGSRVTSVEMRTGAGLNKAQFKEAKKNPEVKRHFDTHVKVSGSGKNTVYWKNEDLPLT